jgi:DNA-binding helix-hairpin-helix protein with protein kinase domain
MAVFFTSTRQKIEVEDKPLGKGGEGSVHRINFPSTLKDHCLKLYQESYRTSERQKKIEFMIRNKPRELNSNIYMLCWPDEAIFDGKGKFVGFLLPLAWSNSVKLYSLCLPDKINPSPKWLSRFDRKTPQGRISRLKLIVNLASAIHSVHSLNKYVFVDMKPDNVLVTEEAKVAIIDLDSVQIAENKTVQFKAKVTTPEYRPPEAINPGENYIPVSWDRFSMAIIFYQLLFGIHPFTATFNGSYESITKTEDAIKKGLFVKGHKWRYVAVLPPPHEEFEHVDAVLQELFKIAFDNGLIRTELRPSAEKWGKTVYEIVNAKIQNATFLANATERTFKDRIKKIKGLS